MSLQRKVIVWGTGINAINFISTNEGIVEAFIDSYKEGTSFLGVPLYKPEHILGLVKKYYIVIASSEYVYWDIKAILDNNGYVEFDDYCYYSVYNKKIAIIYGNCHVAPVKEGLLGIPEFNDTYGFYPLRQIHEIRRLNASDLTSPAVENCDLFLHQSIRDDNSYGIQYASSKILSRLKRDCKVISFPNLHKLPKCFFPQYNSEYLPKKIGGMSYYPFRDEFIEMSYKNGESEHDIALAIRSSNDIWDSYDIQVSYEKFREKVMSREQEWDVKIGRWIDNNYKIRHLFYDQNHPTSAVMRFVIQEIAQLLRMKVSDRTSRGLVELDFYETPIYGQVFKALNLRFDYDYHFYRHSKNTYSGREISLEEYVHEYILWNMKLGE